MELRILKESQVTKSLDEEIRKNLVISFPHNKDIFSHSRKWRGNVPFYNIVLLDGDIVCAHVAVVDRTILAGTANVRVAGVANVFVMPGYRGKGLSDKVLIAAMAEAKKLDFDCGLLFTVENTTHIYTRNGWLKISGQKFIANIDPHIQLRPEDFVEMHIDLEHVHLFEPGDTGNNVSL